MPNSSPTLQRAITYPQSVAMVVGTIIGASIFVQPSEVTGSFPSLGGILAVWLVCGLLTLCGALVCAELASIYTGSGGLYVYLREAFSPTAAFLWGWAMFWVTHSGIIAAVAVIFARYVGFFFPTMDDLAIRLTAVALIVFLTGVNYRGVRYGARVQSLFTAGKLIAIAAVVVVGFLWGSRLPEHFVSRADHALTTTGFLSAVSAGLFAFGGWHMVTHNSEETVDPRRTIPRALLTGTLLVTACYVALNAVYLYVLPLETVMHSERVAADAANALLGYGGGGFMAALVVFSTFGALSGIVLAGPRVYYAMARDGALFSGAGRVHPRFRTPHVAIVAQGIWASLLVFSGSYQALFTRVIYTEWIFFGLVAVGLIRLRRRAGLQREYRIPGYPVTPLLFAAASLCIVVHHLITQPAESLTGLGLVAAGWPVFVIWRRRR